MSTPSTSTTTDNSSEYSAATNTVRTSRPKLVRTKRIDEDDGEFTQSNSNATDTNTNVSNDT